MNLKHILVFMFISIIFISGCSQQEISEKEMLKGVSLSPKSFQSGDFTDFFEKAKQTGTIITWAGDWNELSNTQTGGPAVLAALSTNYNYIPIVEAQFFTQSNSQLLRPLDESTKQIYKDSAVAFAEKYKPRYMGFGIEINTLYEKSPDTKVFTIFQLEKMKGLNSGLFGGSNDKAQWSLLDKFPKSDIIAFTTYPGLIYKNPSDIPADYYTEIQLYTSKTIAFTEIGWHSAASPVGWESSDSEQAEFVEVFFNLSKDLNKELVVWSFLYDQNTIEPFNSMGLIPQEGRTKSAFDAWILSK